MIGKLACVAASALLLAGCAASTPVATAEPVAAVASPTATATPIATTAPPSTTPTAAPSASNGPTPQPTIPLAERPRTFQSKRYGYSFQYPVNIGEGPKAIALVPTQAEPAGWDEIGDGDGDSTFVDTEDVLLRMRTRQRPAGATLSTTVESDIAWFKSHFRAKVQKTSKVRIDGYSGRLVTFTGVRRNGDEVFIQDVVVVAKARILRIYIFTFAGNEAHDRRWFRDIFETFTLAK
jgi:hypothetical protein